MKTFAKLIHRANMSYLPTKTPVQYYGLPDGKVYVIYGRFYEIQYDRTYLEYIFAEHKDFEYDYENEKLIAKDSIKRRTPIYNEMVDKPDSQIKIIQIDRSLNSFAEAFARLNLKAQKILEHKRNENDEDQTISGAKQKNLSATG